MIGIIAVLLALAAPAVAQNAVLFSPDITANLGTVLPALVEDDDVARDDAAGTVVIPALFPSMLAALPAGAEVAGIELPTSAAVGLLLAVDTTVALPGLPANSPAEPRDVVRFDPNTSTFSIAFDGSANGIPAGTQIDAVAANASDQLLLSFDTAVALPGAGTVEDEDLVSVASGSYAVVFDGSANGIGAALDLDAADAEPGQLLLSFDGTGSVPGATFDDEDVLAFATGPATWSKHFDGSTSDPTDWPSADLVALPEPGLAPALAAAFAWLGWLGRIGTRSMRDAGSDYESSSTRSGGRPTTARAPRTRIGRARHAAVADHLAVAARVHAQPHAGDPRVVRPGRDRDRGDAFARQELDVIVDVVSSARRAGRGRRRRDSHQHERRGALQQRLALRSARA